MSRTVIYPYKMGSVSARDLAQSTGLRRVYPDGTFKPRNGDTIINWGSTRLPQWEGWRDRQYSWINHPAGVVNASNKLLTFKLFGEHDVPTVPHTTNREEAQAWADTGSSVIERHSLTGCSGQGIVVVQSGNRLSEQSAPLYTRYVRQANEFRLHVWRGRVIDYTRKARRHDVPDEEVNWRIRNHANGFIYARTGVVLDDPAFTVACSAVASLGLDFGAVDLIQSRSSGEFLALEVNTAPGLVGQTLTNYSDAIREMIDET